MDVVNNSFSNLLILKHNLTLNLVGKRKWTWRENGDRKGREGVCAFLEVCVCWVPLPRHSPPLSLALHACVCVCVSLGFQKRVCPPACTEREGGVSSRLLLPALPLALCYFSLALIPSLAASGLGLLSLSVLFIFYLFLKAECVCVFTPLSWQTFEKKAFHLAIF